MRLEAERWLRATGSDQWSRTERGLRDLTAGVEAGRAYVVSAGPSGILLGTVTLGGPDLDFWADADEPETALYFYKLIVFRGASGLGIGDALIDWAGAQAEAAGKALLRCDCWRTNYRLHDYYRARGFRHVRTVVVPNRGSGTLFERPAARRSAPPGTPELHTA